RNSRACSAQNPSRSALARSYMSGWAFALAANSALGGNVRDSVSRFSSAGLWSVTVPPSNFCGACTSPAYASLAPFGAERHVWRCNPRRGDGANSRWAAPSLVCVGGAGQGGLLAGLFAQDGLAAFFAAALTAGAVGDDADEDERDAVGEQPPGVAVRGEAVEQVGAELSQAVEEHRLRGQEVGQLAGHDQERCTDQGADGADDDRPHRTPACREQHDDQGDQAAGEFHKSQDVDRFDVLAQCI